MKIVMSSLILLILTSAIIGQGVEQSPLPPGDKPAPTVFSRVKDAGDAAKYDSAGYIIVCDSAVTTINKLGVAYTDNYLVYKILTEEGAKELAVLTWGYEPLTNYIEIREVNIIRGDSAFPVPVPNITDLPAPQDGMYWQDRLKSLQLPRLQIGDGIEIKSFRKGFSYALLDSIKGEPDDERFMPPMPGEYFDIIRFEATVPIVEKKYVLKMPSDKRLHSKIYNGPMYSSTTYLGDTTIYSWWTKDVPAWEPQRYGPDDTDIITKVVVATVESWEAKSRWFFDINESQFDFTEAIKTKVDEILADAGVARGSDEARAFELVHWVAQNIRYSGQTMGEGEGYTLHPGAMIFEQRSGVCKDIAGMLVTMMRAAGMDSYAAMTMAGSRIEDVPADQFNHCVVALKKPDGSFEMYDPTWVPFDKDIWSKYEAEQHYLIGTPEGESLSRIPYSPPEESPLYITGAGEITADGTYEGTLELKGDGTQDSRLRGYLTLRHIKEFDNYIALMLHYISDRVQIIDFQYGDLLDFHKSMWWKIKYRIPGYAMPVENGYEFKSPLLLFTNNVMFRYPAADWQEDRRDDLFFYTTILVDARETMKLPKGYKVKESKDSQEINETYVYFKGESEMDGGNLKIKQKTEIKRRQIPSSGYAGFRKTMEEIKKYSQTVFKAEKGGSK
jgi:hypothetical protein